MSDAAKRQVIALLENAICVSSEDERKSYDPAWLAGYVTGMMHAAEMIVELETDEG